MLWQWMMKNVFPVLFVIFGDFCFATNRTKLFQDIIDKQDARVGPFTTAADATPLAVILSLMSIRQVSEKDQTIALSFWVHMSWADPRLTWTPSDYGGIESIVTTSKYVWSPSSVCVYNEIDEDKCFTDESHVSVSHSGWALYLTSRESVTQCAIDISDYPFDSHVCTLYFGNLFPTMDFYSFNMAYSSFMTLYFIQNEEWDLTNTDMRRVKFEYNNITVYQIHFDVKISRRPVYVLLSVLLPVVMLSVLNVFCFVLPIESGEKMGTAMAIFLTFAVFLTIINDSMPRSDKTPSFTVYLVTQLLVSGLTVVLESIVICIHFKGQENQTNQVVPEDSAAKTDYTGFKVNCVNRKRFRISGKALDNVFMIFVIIIDIISLICFLAMTL